MRPSFKDLKETLYMWLPVNHVSWSANYWSLGECSCSYLSNVAITAWAPFTEKSFRSQPESGSQISVKMSIRGQWAIKYYLRLLYLSGQYIFLNTLLKIVCPNRAEHLWATPNRFCWTTLFTMKKNFQPVFISPHQHSTMKLVSGEKNRLENLSISTLEELCPRMVIL